MPVPWISSGEVALTTPKSPVPVEPFAMIAVLNASKTWVQFGFPEGMLTLTTFVAQKSPVAPASPSELAKLKAIPPFEVFN